MGLYALDALIFGQGVVASAFAIIMVVVALIRTMSRPLDRPRLRHGAFIITLYAGLIASVLLTISWNNRLARTRADEVLRALNLYKARHGDYPTQLGALVPEHFSAVPRAKNTYLFNEFRYWYDPVKQEGFLMFTELPPFGRRVFNLRTGNWKYLD